MTSRTTARFRKAFRDRPDHVQRQARRAYKQFLEDQRHPSLHLKQVHPIRPIFSARVSIGYRALAVQDGDDFVWFWIGSHTEYERLISNQ